MSIITDISPKLKKNIVFITQNYNLQTFDRESVFFLTRTPGSSGFQGSQGPNAPSAKAFQTLKISTKNKNKNKKESKPKKPKKKLKKASIDGVPPGGKKDYDDKTMVTWSHKFD